MKISKMIEDHCMSNTILTIGMVVQAGRRVDLSWNLKSYFRFFAIT